VAEATEALRFSGLSGVVAVVRTDLRETGDFVRLDSPNAERSQHRSRRSRDLQ
jgi:hypothetical protein